MPRSSELPRTLGGVILSAAPQDARPAGPEATQSAVMGLAGGAGLPIDVAGPPVLADRNEHPPVDRVAHTPVGGVPESDLPGAPARVTGASPLSANKVREEGNRSRAPPISEISTPR